MSPQQDTAQELVLFYPTGSLVEQLIEPMSLCPSGSITTVMSTRPGTLRAAARGAALSLIDVTERICQAMAALDELAGVCDPRRLGVYTERMHEGLERFVRVRGVLLLLGPLTAEQWQAILRQAGLELRERSAASLHVGKLP